MGTRPAGVLPAIVLGLLPVCAFAFAPGAALQIVPAGRISAVADRIARSVVSDPDRALAPAFIIADQSVPAGMVAIDPGTPQVNATYVSVPIAIAVDGKLARTVFAAYRITNYVQIPVAAHDLAQDTILGADDLVYARVPFSGRAALELASNIGRRVRAPIARGQALYPELTTVNLIVRAGMAALLIVRDGPVHLSADVVARSSGGLGEYVTVFNPQTQKTLSGIVTGPNTVELTLPGTDE